MQTYREQKSYLKYKFLASIMQAVRDDAGVAVFKCALCLSSAGYILFAFLSPRRT